MTTTTPTKSAIVYASAAAGDTILAGVTNTYDIDFSAKIYGGQITVRVQPQAALTTGALVTYNVSDEQATPTFFDMGIDWVSGLTSLVNYDNNLVVTPQLRKIRVSIKNQDATNSIKVFVFQNTYDSLTTV